MTMLAQNTVTVAVMWEAPLRKQRPTVCSEQNETVREKGVRACVACMVSFFLSPFDSSQSSNRRNVCQWGGREGGQ